MSYVLCLGFKTTIYKNEPTIRLSLNNHFVDEFEIDKKFNTTLDDNSVFDKTFFNVAEKKTRYHINSKIHLRYYDINTDLLQNNNTLDIHIKCVSNNYMNGFMTKNSLIAPLIVYLLPKDALLNTKNFIKKYKDAYQFYKNSLTDISDIKKFYKFDKFALYDILVNAIDNGVEWNQQNKEGKKIVFGEWIGGQGHLYLNFNANILCDYKKHKINKTEINPALIYGLANKYLQYENN